MFFRGGTRLFIISIHSFVDAYESGENITTAELSRRHGYSSRAIFPTLSMLIIAGIVKSQTGGIGQGYNLTRSPKDITIYDIVKATFPIPYMTCSLHDKTEDGDDCLLCSITNDAISKLMTKYNAITLYDYAEILRNYDKNKRS